MAVSSPSPIVEGQTETPTVGDESIPRLKLSQTSYNGLQVFSGNIHEECSHELRWPRVMQTYKDMAKDATIAPALTLVETALSRPKWSISIPEGYEAELKDKAAFLRQCMGDMEHSWGSFIRQCVTFNRYGFAPHEKVYRKRLKRNGSKYDDGLIGIGSLPLISQDSIESWDWENAGKKLSGLYQYVNEPKGKNQTEISARTTDMFIPRKKFMLFRNSPLKDSPIGVSPLASCWTAWKYKTSLEQFEALGVSSDMRGLKVLYIPPRYMAEDASDADKQVYLYYQSIMRNLHMNEQSGLILPQVIDENGQPSFKFDVISITGQKSHDVDSIIVRYKTEIITALMANQLVLGQGGGSSTLSEGLQTISNISVESKLTEIQDQLNHDLIPQLFQLNGWSTDVLPTFEFGDIVSPDLDVLSKFIQRAGAAGLLRKTPATVAWLAKQANMPVDFLLDVSQEEFEKLLTGFTSSAGQGMVEGLGSGVGMATGGGDKTATNNENS